MITGTGALARMDAIGKVISPSRRALFFATRNFWGGVLVFGVGFVVRYLLDPVHGQPFPLSFTWFFVLSCGSFIGAALTFSQIKEMPDVVEQPRHSLKAQLARAPTLIKQDSTFQRYLWVRVLLNMTRLAEPFYPILRKPVDCFFEKHGLSFLVLDRIYVEPEVLALNDRFVQILDTGRFILYAYQPETDAVVSKPDGGAA